MTEQKEQTIEESLDLDFNRLDKLIQIADPRMDNLSADEKFEISKGGYDRIRFCRNGVEAKYQLIFDEQNWTFRPLSIQEEFDCDRLARDDYHKLEEHQRTEAYRIYRFKIHQLAMSNTATPESDKEKKLKVKHLEKLPSSYLLGLYNEWFLLMQDINPNIDKMTVADEHRMIAEIENEPSLVGKCSPQRLRLLFLRLLAVNMSLRGNAPSA